MRYGSSWTVTSERPLRRPDRRLVACEAGAGGREPASRLTTVGRFEVVRETSQEDCSTWPEKPSASPTLYVSANRAGQS